MVSQTKYAASLLCLMCLAGFPAQAALEPISGMPVMEPTVQEPTPSCTAAEVQIAKSMLAGWKADLERNKEMQEWCLKEYGSGTPGLRACLGDLLAEEQDLEKKIKAKQAYLDACQASAAPAPVACDPFTGLCQLKDW